MSLFYKTNIQKHLRIINKYLVIFTCISKLIELNYWNLKTLTLITHNVCACIWIFSLKQTSIKFPRYRSNWTNQKIDCSSNKTTKKMTTFSQSGSCSRTSWCEIVLFPRFTVISRLRTWLRTANSSRRRCYSDRPVFSPPPRFIFTTYANYGSAVPF